jgi:uncharacterized protein
MRQDGTRFVLSATDLSNFLGCRHRTALDMEAAAGKRERPHFEDPLLELLFKRGTDHEKAYVDKLRAEDLDVLDLSHIFERDELLAATEAALRAGRDIVVQGALSDDQWYGKPDILRRVATPSTFGPWSYEVVDTKLALETRAGAILQLGLYSEMLGVLQGVRPERFYVVTPDPQQPVHTYRVNDFAAYVRLTRRRLLETVSQRAEDVAAANYPEPVDHCQICPWSGECRGKRRHDDHLSLVAGITRTQRRELETRDTNTLTQLGLLPAPIPFKPDRGSVESYERVRDQARLQLDSRDRTPPLHELLDVVEGEGLCRLPAPSPGDIFLDLEGDHLAVEGGREYLFGLVTRGNDGEPQYSSFWALDDRDEKAAFEHVIDRIVDAIERHPDMHVYHYAPYETTAFKRLMGRYATRETELDGMLRAGRFVDLYAVVRQGLRAGIERYSIKNLEPLYAFTRAVPLEDAGKGLRAFEYALAIGAMDALPAEVRTTVEGYNKDDCVSTLRLYEWLETMRATAVAAGANIPRPVLDAEEPKPELKERQRLTEELRARLLAGIGGVPPKDTPEHARWLLAYLLDFHRREDKASWWKYFELCDSTDDELLDEPEAVAGLEYRERMALVLNKKTKKPTGSVVDRYVFPPQEMEIRRGGELKTRDGKAFGEVIDVDRVNRTIDIQKGPSKADLHPSAVFAHTHVRTDVLESAIATLAEGVAPSNGVDAANGIARSLLLRETPRLTTGSFCQPNGEAGGDFAANVVKQLDRTLLAIQGPPGSGKTFTGARMICALVAEGKRVGVMGPSHKAILNLLEGTVEAAAESGANVRVAHRTGDDDDELPAGVEAVENSEARSKLAAREVDVVGGTAWLWARPDMVGSVDVLFVDEAGQVSLANAIAVSAAAESMVLLGDPQQLDQPLKGSHPDGVEASVLQHIVGDHGTIPRDKGIFLAETWRLSPSLCAFTSELFYESRLAPRAGLERQVLTGLDGLSGSGLWYVDVEHDGRTSASDEEVSVVAALVERLIAPGSSWVSSKGGTAQLGLDDILVVSPFNAQVSRLVERLPAGARVGTVDKFQGQAAPVVIYSMATSRPEDAPRGLSFLYSLNRLNVATSRAQCVVIVVANRRLFEVECRSPRQMVLANALCRYRELARYSGLERHDIKTF